MGVVLTPFPFTSRFISKKVATASLKEKVFAKDTKNVVKTLSWNLGFELWLQRELNLHNSMKFQKKWKMGTKNDILGRSRVQILMFFAAPG